MEETSNLGVDYILEPNYFSNNETRKIPSTAELIQCLALQGSWISSRDLQV
jgi:hypothetical protein